MAKTPIFGPFSVSASTNLSDAQCMNLIPKIEDTKQGKAGGALFSIPGLTLFVTCGGGPIWSTHVLDNHLYVVSGENVYKVDTSGTVTPLGVINGVSTAPNMVDNGSQLGIFTNTGAWLIGLHGQGQPLTGGTIATAGTAYSVNDYIYLAPNDGMQQATAAIKVTAVDGSGGVTGFSILVISNLPLGGSFSTLPTGFAQSSTTGSGSDFTLSAPTYGAATYLYPIPLPFIFTPSVSGAPIPAAQLDGYILIAQPDSYLLWQCDLLDMSIWNALAFGEASANPDAIQSLQQVHLQVYVIETYGTEVWVDAGTSPFAFQRLSGVHIEKGTFAPASVTQIGEDIMWLATEHDGNCVVVRVRGYNPTVVSDASVTRIWQTYPTTNDAIAYSYQLGGRWYYVISFPTGDSTWVYGVTESELLGVPCWHQRGSFLDGVFHRYWAQSGTGANTQGHPFVNHILVGDYRNGNIYLLDPTTLTDNGTARKWVRSWRALPPNESTVNPTRFNSLQIDMQTGVDLPYGTNPQVVLRWSDDGGHNWSNEIFGSVGSIGKTAQRVKFNRLGSTRRNSGLDRIFELSSTDVFPVAIINAELT